MGSSSSSLLLSSLELIDTKVYEPYIRALLGTASHYMHIELGPTQEGTQLGARLRVPEFRCVVHRPAVSRFGVRDEGAQGVQGYLAHKKRPHPLGPPYDPRYSPTVGS